MCYLDLNTHIAIHPVYGQWFSLRAIVVIDRLLRKAGPHKLMPCPLSEERAKMLKKLFDEASGLSGDSTEGAARQGIGENWQKLL